VATFLSSALTQKPSKSAKFQSSTVVNRQCKWLLNNWIIMSGLSTVWIGPGLSDWSLRGLMTGWLSCWWCLIWRRGILIKFWSWLLVDTKLLSAQSASTQ
jgi:hypothetical protein